MDSVRSIAHILGVGEQMLRRLDAVMADRTGRAGVLERVSDEHGRKFAAALAAFGISGNDEAAVREGLRGAILRHERELLEAVHAAEGSDEFERAASLARGIANVGKGLFLKKEFGREILSRRPPQNLLAFLKCGSVDELCSRHDIVEIFSALRFMESDAWMHETFEAAYSSFTPNDFEDRDIEIRVLGPAWKEVSAKFVAKKHHNVSHLKEFGVIFLNPVKEDMPAKFLRDFALLFHYLHEIDFYSALFRVYAGRPDFAEKLKMLLRGDVASSGGDQEGRWLIVQRYLFKDNPKDPRLFVPRINPESVHWMRGERDLTAFAESRAGMGLKLWQNLDWVGGVIGAGAVVSLDLEDNAMAAVSHEEGAPQLFSYHQREALWTKLFIEYVGGEGTMQELLTRNFDKGEIQF